MKEDDQMKKDEEKWSGEETIVLYSLNCSPIRYFLSILSFPFLSNIAKVAFLSLQWKYASLHGAVPALR